jgi:CRP-like cAMP-binding protein
VGVLALLRGVAGIVWRVAFPMSAVRDEREVALRTCYLFAGLAPESLAPLARASSIRVIPPGTEIFAAGDTADGLRVVISGQVRLWIADRDGRELTLHFAEAGDSFGEIALLDSLPRSAAATALETTRCLLLPVAAVENTLAADPVVARHLILSLCTILRRNVDTIGGFAFSGLDARLARRLFDLAHSHAEIEGPSARFTRRFSQTDLAQLLGVTREAINKKLRALEHDGLVLREGGSLFLPDLPGLAARAEIERRMGLG